MKHCKNKKTQRIFALHKKLNASVLCQEYVN